MANDLRVLTLGENTGRFGLVNGIRRLCQRLVIELLTAVGSMQYLPERGTNFLPRLRQNSISEFDILVAFAAAKHQLRRNLRNEETSQTGLDERYRDCRLSQIVFGSGKLQLELMVQNQARTTMRIITPPIQL